MTTTRAERTAVADPHRVAAVHATRLLDTEPEEAFDRLTRLAADLVEVPMVFVTLVDDHRSYWKSTAGFDAGPPERRQNAVEDSFCQFVVEADAEQAIPDTHVDGRASDMAAVEVLDIAAWVGLPIRAKDGEVLGTFCAMDTRPRRWSDRDLEVLRTMAHAAAGEIALRVALRETQEAQAEAERHALLAVTRAAEATELARTLQQSLLPIDLPRVPGMEVAARWRPGGRGAEVLGDFYDLFPVPGGWGVVIGDVCGKGPWAARTTALARSTMRAVGHTEPRPEAVMAALNEVLHVWFDGHRSFVTAVYATFVASGTGLDVVVVNGGHPPSFVLRADGGVQGLPEGGRPLGLFPEASVAREELHLAPGDGLVLYTDGVTESRVRGGEQFELDGVERTLAGLGPGASAETVADALGDAALAHATGAVPDDTAVVVVRRVAE